MTQHTKNDSSFGDEHLRKLPFSDSLLKKLKERYEERGVNFTMDSLPEEDVKFVKYIDESSKSKDENKTSSGFKESYYAIARDEHGYFIVEIGKKNIAPYYASEEKIEQAFLLKYAKDFDATYAELIKEFNQQELLEVRGKGDIGRIPSYLPKMVFEGVSLKYVEAEALDVNMIEGGNMQKEPLPKNDIITEIAKELDIKKSLKSVSHYIFSSIEANFIAVRLSTEISKDLYLIFSRNDKEKFTIVATSIKDDEVITAYDREYDSLGSFKDDVENLWNFAFWEAIKKGKDQEFFGYNISLSDVYFVDEKLDFTTHDFKPSQLLSLPRLKRKGASIELYFQDIEYREFIKSALEDFKKDSSVKLSDYYIVKVVEQSDHTAIAWTLNINVGNDSKLIIMFTKDDHYTAYYVTENNGQPVIELKSASTHCGDGCYSSKSPHSKIPFFTAKTEEISLMSESFITSLFELDITNESADNKRRENVGRREDVESKKQSDEELIHYITEDEREVSNRKEGDEERYRDFYRQLCEKAGIEVFNAELRCVFIKNTASHSKTTTQLYVIDDLFLISKDASGYTLYHADDNAVQLVGAVELTFNLRSFCVESKDLPTEYDMMSTDDGRRAVINFAIGHLDLEETQSIGSIDPSEFEDAANNGIFQGTEEEFISEEEFQGTEEEFISEEEFQGTEQKPTFEQESNYNITSEVGGDKNSSEFENAANNGISQGAEEKFIPEEEFQGTEEEFISEEESNYNITSEVGRYKNSSEFEDAANNGTFQDTEQKPTFEQESNYNITSEVGRYKNSSEFEDAANNGTFQDTEQKPTFEQESNYNITSEVGRYKNSSEFENAANNDTFQDTEQKPTFEQESNYNITSEVGGDENPSKFEDAANNGTFQDTEQKPTFEQESNYNHTTSEVGGDENPSEFEDAADNGISQDTQEDLIFVQKSDNERILSEIVDRSKENGKFGKFEGESFAHLIIESGTVRIIVISHSGSESGMTQNESIMHISDEEGGRGLYYIDDAGKVQHYVDDVISSKMVQFIGEPDHVLNIPRSFATNDAIISLINGMVYSEFRQSDLDDKISEIEKEKFLEDMNHFIVDVFSKKFGITVGAYKVLKYTNTVDNKDSYVIVINADSVEHAVMLFRESQDVDCYIINNGKVEKGAKVQYSENLAFTNEVNALSGKVDDFSDDVIMGFAKVADGQLSAMDLEWLMDRKPNVHVLSKEIAEILKGIGGAFILHNIKDVVCYAVSNKQLALKFSLNEYEKDERNVYLVFENNEEDFYVVFSDVANRREVKKVSDKALASSAYAVLGDLNGIVKGGVKKFLGLEISSRNTYYRKDGLFNIEDAIVVVGDEEYVKSNLFESNVTRGTVIIGDSRFSSRDFSVQHDDFYKILDSIITESTTLDISAALLQYKRVKLVIGDAEYDVFVSHLKDSGRVKHLLFVMEQKNIQLFSVDDDVVTQLYTRYNTSVVPSNIEIEDTKKYFGKVKFPNDNGSGYLYKSKLIEIATGKELSRGSDVMNSELEQYIMESEEFSAEMKSARASLFDALSSAEVTFGNLIKKEKAKEGASEFEIVLLAQLLQFLKAALDIEMYVYHKVKLASSELEKASKANLAMIQTVSDSFSEFYSTLNKGISFKGTLSGSVYRENAALFAKLFDKITSFSQYDEYLNKRIALEKKFSTLQDSSFVSSDAVNLYDVSEESLKELIALFGKNRKDASFVQSTSLKVNLEFALNGYFTGSANIENERNSVALRDLVNVLEEQSEQKILDLETLLKTISRTALNGIVIVERSGKKEMLSSTFPRKALIGEILQWAADAETFCKAIAGYTTSKISSVRQEVLKIVEKFTMEVYEFKRLEEFFKEAEFPSYKGIQAIQDLSHSSYEKDEQLRKKVDSLLKAGESELKAKCQFIIEVGQRINHLANSNIFVKDEQCISWNDATSDITFDGYFVKVKEEYLSIMIKKLQDIIITWSKKSDEFVKMKENIDEQVQYIEAKKIFEDLQEQFTTTEEEFFNKIKNHDKRHGIKYTVSHSKEAAIGNSFSDVVRTHFYGYLANVDNKVKSLLEGNWWKANKESKELYNKLIALLHKTNVDDIIGLHDEFDELVYTLQPKAIAIFDKAIDAEKSKRIKATEKLEALFIECKDEQSRCSKEDINAALGDLVTEEGVMSFSATGYITRSMIDVIQEFFTNEESEKFHRIKKIISGISNKKEIGEKLWQHVLRYPVEAEKFNIEMSNLEKAAINGTMWQSVQDALLNEKLHVEQFGDFISIEEEIFEYRKDAIQVNALLIKEAYELIKQDESLSKGVEDQHDADRIAKTLADERTSLIAQYNLVEREKELLQSIKKWKSYNMDVLGDIELRVDNVEQIHRAQMIYGSVAAADLGLSVINNFNVCMSALGEVRDRVVEDFKKAIEDTQKELISQRDKVESLRLLAVIPYSSSELHEKEKEIAALSKLLENTQEQFDIKLKEAEASLSSLMNDVFFANITKDALLITDERLKNYLEEQKATAHKVEDYESKKRELGDKIAVLKEFEETLEEVLSRSDALSIVMDKKARWYSILEERVQSGDDTLRDILQEDSLNSQEQADTLLEKIEAHVRLLNGQLGASEQSQSDNEGGVLSSILKPSSIGGSILHRKSLEELHKSISSYKAGMKDKLYAPIEVVIEKSRGELEVAQYASYIIELQDSGKLAQELDLFKKTLIKDFSATSMIAMWFQQAKGRVKQVREKFIADNKLKSAQELRQISCFSNNESLGCDSKIADVYELSEKYYKNLDIFGFATTELHEIGKELYALLRYIDDGRDVAEDTKGFNLREVISTNLRITSEHVRNHKVHIKVLEAEKSAISKWDAVFKRKVEAIERKLHKFSSEAKIEDLSSKIALSRDALDKATTAIDVKLKNLYIKVEIREWRENVVKIYAEFQKAITDISMKELFKSLKFQNFNFAPLTESNSVKLALEPFENYVSKMKEFSEYEAFETKEALKEMEALKVEMNSFISTQENQMKIAIGNIKRNYDAVEAALILEANSIRSALLASLEKYDQDVLLMERGDIIELVNKEQNKIASAFNSNKERFTALLGKIKDEIEEINYKRYVNEVAYNEDMSDSIKELITAYSNILKAKIDDLSIGSLIDNLEHSYTKLSHLQLKNEARVLLNEYQKKKAKLILDGVRSGEKNIYTTIHNEYVLVLEKVQNIQAQFEKNLKSVGNMLPDSALYQKFDVNDAIISLAREDVLISEQIAVELKNELLEQEQNLPLQLSHNLIFAELRQQILDEGRRCSGNDRESFADYIRQKCISKTIFNFSQFKKYDNGAVCDVSDVKFDSSELALYDYTGYRLHYAKEMQKVVNSFIQRKDNIDSVLSNLFDKSNADIITPAALKDLLLKKEINESEAYEVIIGIVDKAAERYSVFDITFVLSMAQRVLYDRLSRSVEDINKLIQNYSLLFTSHPSYEKEKAIFDESVQKLENAWKDSSYSKDGLILRKEVESLYSYLKEGDSASSHVWPYKSDQEICERLLLALRDKEETSDAIIQYLGKLGLSENKNLVVKEALTNWFSSDRKQVALDKLFLVLWASIDSGDRYREYIIQAEMDLVERYVKKVYSGNSAVVELVKDKAFKAIKQSQSATSKKEASKKEIQYKYDSISPEEKWMCVKISEKVTSLQNSYKAWKGNSVKVDDTLWNDPLFSTIASNVSRAALLTDLNFADKLAASKAILSDTDVANMRSEFSALEDKLIHTLPEKVMKMIKEKEQLEKILQIMKHVIQFTTAEDSSSVKAFINQVDLYISGGVATISDIYHGIVDRYKESELMILVNKSNRATIERVIKEFEQVLQAKKSDIINEAVPFLKAAVADDGSILNSTSTVLKEISNDKTNPSFNMRFEAIRDALTTDKSVVDLGKLAEGKSIINSYLDSISNEIFSFQERSKLLNSYISVLEDRQENAKILLNTLQSSIDINAVNNNWNEAAEFLQNLKQIIANGRKSNSEGLLEDLRKFVDSTYVAKDNQAGATELLKGVRELIADGEQYSESRLLKELEALVTIFNVDLQQFEEQVTKFWKDLSQNLSRGNVFVARYLKDIKGTMKKLSPITEEHRKYANSANELIESLLQELNPALVKEREMLQSLISYRDAVNGKNFIQSQEELLKYPLFKEIKSLSFYDAYEALQYQFLYNKELMQLSAYDAFNALESGQGRRNTKAEFMEVINDKANDVLFLEELPRALTGYRASATMSDTDLSIFGVTSQLSHSASFPLLQDDKNRTPADKLFAKALTSFFAVPAKDSPSIVEAVLLSTTSTNVGVRNFISDAMDNISKIYDSTIEDLAGNALTSKVSATYNTLDEWKKTLGGASLSEAEMKRFFIGARDEIYKELANFEKNARLLVEDAAEFRALSIHTAGMFGLNVTSKESKTVFQNRFVDYINLATALKKLALPGKYYSEIMRQALKFMTDAFRYLDIREVETAARGSVSFANESKDKISSIVKEVFGKDYITENDFLISIRTEVQKKITDLIHQGVVVREIENTHQIANELKVLVGYLLKYDSENSTLSENDKLQNFKTLKNIKDNYLRNNWFNKPTLDREHWWNTFTKQYRTISDSYAAGKYMSFSEIVKMAYLSMVNSKEYEKYGNELKKTYGKWHHDFDGVLNALKNSSDFSDDSDVKLEEAIERNSNSIVEAFWQNIADVVHKLGAEEFPNTESFRERLGKMIPSHFGMKDVISEFAHTIFSTYSRSDATTREKIDLFIVVVNQLSIAATGREGISINALQEAHGGKLSLQILEEKLSSIVNDLSAIKNAFTDTVIQHHSSARLFSNAVSLHVSDINKAFMAPLLEVDVEISLSQQLAAQVLTNFVSCSLRNGNIMKYQDRANSNEMQRIEALLAEMQCVEWNEIFVPEKLSKSSVKRIHDYLSEKLSNISAEQFGDISSMHAFLVKDQVLSQVFGLGALQGIFDEFKEYVTQKLDMKQADIAEMFVALLKEQYARFIVSAKESNLLEGANEIVPEYIPLQTIAFAAISERYDMKSMEDFAEKYFYYSELFPKCLAHTEASFISSSWKSENEVAVRNYCNNLLRNEGKNPDDYTEVVSLFSSAIYRIREDIGVDALIGGVYNAQIIQDIKEYVFRDGVLDFEKYALGTVENNFVRSFAAKLKKSVAIPKVEKEKIEKEVEVITKRRDSLSKSVKDFEKVQQSLGGIYATVSEYSEAKSELNNYKKHFDENTAEILKNLRTVIHLGVVRANKDIATLFKELGLGDFSIKDSSSFKAQVQKRFNKETQSVTEEVDYSLGTLTAKEPEEFKAAITSLRQKVTEQQWNILGSAIFNSYQSYKAPSAEKMIGALKSLSTYELCDIADRIGISARNQVMPDIYSFLRAFAEKIVANGEDFLEDFVLTAEEFDKIKDALEKAQVRGDDVIRNPNIDVNILDIDDEAFLKSLGDTQYRLADLLSIVAKEDNDAIEWLNDNLNNKEKEKLIRAVVASYEATDSKIGDTIGVIGRISNYLSSYFIDPSEENAIHRAALQKRLSNIQYKSEESEKNMKRDISRFIETQVEKLFSLVVEMAKHLDGDNDMVNAQDLFSLVDIMEKSLIAHEAISSDFSKEIHDAADSLKKLETVSFKVKTIWSYLRDDEPVSLMSTIYSEMKNYLHQSASAERMFIESNNKALDIKEMFVRLLEQFDVIPQRFLQLDIEQRDKSIAEYIAEREEENSDIAGTTVLRQVFSFLKLFNADSRLVSAIHKIIEDNEPSYNPKMMIGDAMIEELFSVQQRAEVIDEAIAVYDKWYSENNGNIITAAEAAENSSIIEDLDKQIAERQEKLKVLNEQLSEEIVTQNINNFNTTHINIRAEELIYGNLKDVLADKDFANILSDAKMIASYPHFIKFLDNVLLYKTNKKENSINYIKKMEDALSAFLKVCKMIASLSKYEIFNVDILKFDDIDSVAKLIAKLDLSNIQLISDEGGKTDKALQSLQSALISKLQQIKDIVSDGAAELRTLKTASIPLSEFAATDATIFAFLKNENSMAFGYSAFLSCPVEGTHGFANIAERQYPFSIELQKSSNSYNVEYLLADMNTKMSEEKAKECGIDKIPDFLKLVCEKTFPRDKDRDDKAQHGADNEYFKRLQRTEDESSAKLSVDIKNLQNLSGQLVNYIKKELQDGNIKSYEDVQSLVAKDEKYSPSIQQLISKINGDCEYATISCRTLDVNGIIANIDSAPLLAFNEHARAISIANALNDHLMKLCRAHEKDFSDGIEQELLQRVSVIERAFKVLIEQEKWRLSSEMKLFEMQKADPSNHETIDKYRSLLNELLQHRLSEKSEMEAIKYYEQSHIVQRRAEIEYLEKELKSIDKVNDVTFSSKIDDILSSFRTEYQHMQDAREYYYSYHTKQMRDTVVSQQKEFTELLSQKLAPLSLNADSSLGGSDSVTGVDSELREKLKEDVETAKTDRYNYIQLSNFAKKNGIGMHSLEMIQAVSWVYSYYNVDYRAYRTSSGDWTAKQKEDMISKSNANMNKFIAGRNLASGELDISMQKIRQLVTSMYNDDISYFRKEMEKAYALVAKSLTEYVTSYKFELKAEHSDLRTSYYMNVLKQSAAAEASRLEKFYLTDIMKVLEGHKKSLVEVERYNDVKDKYELIAKNQQKLQDGLLKPISNYESTVNYSAVREYDSAIAQCGSMLRKLENLEQKASQLSKKEETIREEIGQNKGWSGKKNEYIAFSREIESLGNTLPSGNSCEKVVPFNDERVMNYSKVLQFILQENARKIESKKQTIHTLLSNKVREMQTYLAHREHMEALDNVERLLEKSTKALNEKILKITPLIINNAIDIAVYESYVAAARDDVKNSAEYAVMKELCHNRYSDDCDEVDNRVSNFGASIIGDLRSVAMVVGSEYAEALKKLSTETELVAQRIGKLTMLEEKDIRSAEDELDSSINSINEISYGRAVTNSNNLELHKILLLELQSKFAVAKSKAIEQINNNFVMRREYVSLSKYVIFDAQNKEFRQDENVKNDIWLIVRDGFRKSMEFNVQSCLSDVRHFTEQRITMPSKYKMREKDISGMEQSYESTLHYSGLRCIELQGWHDDTKRKLSSHFDSVIARMISHNTADDSKLKNVKNDFRNDILDITDDTLPGVVHSRTNYMTETFTYWDQRFDNVMPKILAVNALKKSSALKKVDLYSSASVLAKLISDTNVKDIQNALPQMIIELYHKDLEEISNTIAQYGFGSELTESSTCMGIIEHVLTELPDQSAITKRCKGLDMQYNAVKSEVDAISKVIEYANDKVKSYEASVRRLKNEKVNFFDKAISAMQQCETEINEFVGRELSTLPYDIRDAVRKKITACGDHLKKYSAQKAEIQEWSSRDFLAEYKIIGLYSQELKRSIDNELLCYYSDETDDKFIAGVRELDKCASILDASRAYYMDARKMLHSVPSYCALSLFQKESNSLIAEKLQILCDSLNTKVKGYGILLDSGESLIKSWDELYGMMQNSSIYKIDYEQIKAHFMQRAANDHNKVKDSMKIMQEREVIVHLENKEDLYIKLLNSKYFCRDLSEAVYTTYSMETCYTAITKDDFFVSIVGGADYFIMNEYNEHKADITIDGGIEHS
ncbi:hypothetical protein Fsol_00512 [Candidatus Fokinia solitaria]|uniref:Uncharacterized protein n=1 Tax=Candidatus Fokinia solitaria TaxID=1802984 RepID=A0A2U8BSG8_9RICK|nr:hypothetical protein [Candidatus Fokinia solitaria]AWD33306.1 hypothetical protein Fsol_00512 [Candidatus Fokinia solitaria]